MTENFRNDHAQIITSNGKPTFAVLPYEEYLSLLNQVDIPDEQLFLIAQARDEEFFPSDIIDRILTGKNPVRIYREYRQLIQQELANKIGKSKQYIASIENGAKKGSAETLKNIAEALRIDLDIII